MRIQHWQDVASLLVGLWLVASPFALGFAGAAVWITIALGLAVILFPVEVFIIPSYLEEWGEMILGLALVLAPWMVGYESGPATASSVLSGILVILVPPVPPDHGRPRVYRPSPTYTRLSLKNWRRPVSQSPEHRANAR